MINHFLRCLFLPLALILLSISLAFAQNQVHIDSLMESLKVAEKTEKVDVWNSLSREYLFFDPAKAINYAEKALSLSHKINYEAGMAYSFHNIGTAYGNQRELTSSRKYFYLALPLYERVDDPLGKARCLNDIGEMYQVLGDYKFALDKFIRAVEIYESQGYKQGTALVLSNIAFAYHKLARYKTALDFALKSYTISEEIGVYEGLKKSSLILSDAFANMGDFKKAYEYHTLHTHIKDSLFRVEKTLEIGLIEEKFAKEKRETEQKMRKELEAEKALKAKRDRDNIQYSFIFLIFVGLFVAIFVMGKFDIPQSYLESLIFLTLLLVFRFILIILTSMTHEFSQGAPIFILGANVIMAILFMPLHKLLESRLKKKVIEEQSTDEKLKVNFNTKNLKQPFVKVSKVDSTRSEKKSAPSS